MYLYSQRPYQLWDTTIIIYIGYKDYFIGVKAIGA
jgi:hypothetical protein